MYKDPRDASIAGEKFVIGPDALPKVMKKPNGLRQSSDPSAVDWPTES